MASHAFSRSREAPEANSRTSRGGSGSKTSTNASRRPSSSRGIHADAARIFLARIFTVGIFL